MNAATLAVIAKAPAPGRSKTRLCPPLSSIEAAELAEAALRDTLRAVVDAAAGRAALVLDGRPGPWLPAGVEVIPQRGDGLDERLANAFSDLQGPALIIGMDTPQVSPALLERGVRSLRSTDAVLGPALDGGYWAIGMRAPDPRALLEVPMSTAVTLAAQRLRLHELGLDVSELAPLRDVDTYTDAIAVAGSAPDTAFARALSRLTLIPAAA
jgi:rSAM/selenodomain-associated transferase 1